MSAKSSPAREPQSGRGRRCRVLLVAPTGCDRAARLCERIGPQALLANNAFSAIGELTASPAREPIELIVLAESALAGASDHPTAALRRIDPAVRVVLVRDIKGGNGNVGVHVPADVFDGVIDEWPSADVLVEMLTGENSGAEDQTSGERSQKTAAVAGQRPMAQRDQPIDEVRSATAGASDNAAPPAELGDVDLVEAVIRSRDDDPGSLRETALAVIRQHTGWSDAALVERKAAGGDDGGGPARADDRAKPQAAGHEAPVRYGDREFGTLRSRKAATGELARWADWLARWLALDEDHRRWRELAERDPLTGAYNRRYFMTFLTDAIKHAAKKRLPIAVMVFDLDDFKRYNDEFGHAAGDEILRETVRLLNSVIRKSDRVCRIGGDEFAVVFTDPGGPRERGSAPPETAEVLAQRFQDQVCQMRFPKLGIEAPGTLSVSAGLATFPWDGWDPEALLNHADALALQSKRKGKNALTLGRGAQQRCGETGDELL